jgi:hypothetical protein
MFILSVTLSDEISRSKVKVLEKAFYLNKFQGLKLNDYGHVTIRILEPFI